jgi:hypothetical protein
MNKKIILLIAFILIGIINTTYANECEFVLPREAQDAPFYKYDCITVYPIMFGRITTEDVSITDVNISIGSTSEEINSQITNNYFFINLDTQKQFTNVRMNVFPRSILNSFNVSEDEIKIRFPFSFFR